MNFNRGASAIRAVERPAARVAMSRGGDPAPVQVGCWLVAEAPRFRGESGPSARQRQSGPARSPPGPAGGCPHAGGAGEQWRPSPVHRGALSRQGGLPRQDHRGDGRPRRSRLPVRKRSDRRRDASDGPPGLGDDRGQKVLARFGLAVAKNAVSVLLPIISGLGVVTRRSHHAPGGATRAAHDILAASVTVHRTRYNSRWETPLWVQGPAASRAALARYVVLSANGSPIARLAVTAGFRVTDVGRDYVVGIHRDDDGVETVRAYALTR
jgi:hypothetical protein